MITPEICPECRQPIPTRKNGPPLLKCPLCLAAKSYQHVLSFQKSFLDRIGRGEIQLSFRKAAGTAKWHVAFLQYRDQAWCGTRIHTGWKGKQHLPWSKAPESTCERCREVIQQMLEDKTTEVA